MNQFLDFLPADGVSFSKNISRANKIAAVSDWIHKIFSDKQQIVQVVDAKEFSAAELEQAVSSSNAELQKKLAYLEKKLADADKIKPATELEKKRKHLEKSIQTQQLELKKLKDALKAEMDEDDDGSDSSDDISDESEEDERKNAKKLKPSGSSKSDLGGFGVGLDTRIASNPKMFSK
jgi:hypothetical protein